ncbi:hypothetical protein LCGC14_2940740, partial [marine sediment metagenome]
MTLPAMIACTLTFDMAGFPDAIELIGIVIAAITVGMVIGSFA